ncbi:hypothetical protein DFJ74DRAFT_645426 [Hyaloraphidium curvatum]|nr:hypothetical protein DFJ74DRAFT_645426 [Hyaloraphidium curvatum]
MRRRLPALLLLGLAVAALSLLPAAAAGLARFNGASRCAACRPRRTQSGRAPVPGYYRPETAPPGNATVVSVGFYAMNAYDLDTSKNTYWLTGYLWFRWPNGTDYDPIKSLEINNGVQDVDFTVQKVTEQPTVAADGMLVQELHIQGLMYQPFDLRNFPLDQQRLTLNVEDSVHQRDHIVYVPDFAESGLDALLVVPGWNLVDLQAETMIHDYESNFGVTGAPEDEEYSAVRFSLVIERGQNFFIWRLLLPLCLVVISSWFSLVLHPKYVEVRTAMSATALLTAVFLQQTNLVISGLTLMDEIYVFCYLLIISTFGLVVWDNNRILEFRADEKEAHREEEELMDEDEKRTRKAELRKNKVKEKEVIKSIRFWNTVALATEFVVAIVVITTICVMQSRT